MPRIQTNFCLFASDLNRAILFYQQNFGFQLEGTIEVSDRFSWAALRTENALLWLGPTGAKNGLIILVEKKLAEFIHQLKKCGVTVFLPDELIERAGNNELLTTDWGKHAWLLDSEGNVIMLLEPLIDE